MDDPQRISTAAGQKLVATQVAEDNRVFDQQQNHWADSGPGPNTWARSGRLSSAWEQAKRGVESRGRRQSSQILES